MAESSVVYAVAAYILIWAMLLGYVLVIARRQSALQGEIEELEQIVLRKSSGS